jgi:hypothetical protein
MEAFSIKTKDGSYIYICYEAVSPKKKIAKLTVESRIPAPAEA